MRCLKSILLFFFIASQVESVGQVFPVQSTVQLTPPYSLYLSDYAAPGSERLRVTAFLIDATRPELNVRFRLRIEGNGIKIETKPEFLPPPVALLGGVPLQLVSSDLAAYFDPRNLNFTGITQREIEQRGALPEGLYQFCFEVIEYNRGVKISNTGCAVAWLILNDPPIVNLPRDNEKIRIQDPQQVVFQWTPRHRGSPNSAFNAEYDFKLVEVWPSTRNPNDAILTSPVIFQTTTSETTLIYGPAETPLEPGRRYAFQIRVRAYAGADEVSLFKNNGFSQVYTFVYGDACLAPQNIIASDIGTTRFSVNFEGAPNHSSYSLRYRPIPNPQVPSSNWYTTTSLTPNLTINSLQPNTRYEFQVNAGCGTFTSDYSLVTNVTTKDNPGIQYSCGVPLTPFNLDPSQLINSLKVGDVIKAGDFDVTLSKVSGSNGTFSGEGVIEVSYFNRAKVKAEFTNINVNNEMRMVNGYMNVTGAGVEVIPAGVMNLMDNLDEALALADKALDEYEANLPQQFDENAAVTSTLITVPGTATVTAGSNGSVVIVDGSGKRTEVPAGTTASVVDSSGKGYIIDSKGKVHTTTAAIATAAAKREYNLKLKFAEAQDQKFGFDAKRYDPIASTYTKVEDQFLSWKSVATGNTDKALVLLEGAGIDKSKIRYELGGLELRPQDLGTQSPSPNAQSLELRGTADGLEEELIALYDPPSPNSQPPSPNSQVPSSKTQVLGKLSVITYDQIVKDLVIVPVNGNKYPYSEDALRTQLNKIYGQAVVKWNITFASNLDVPGIDPFDDGGSGLLSNYSPDMRKVVNAYKANVQRNTYYLFLVKNPKSTTLAGFMPRSKECGFIFVDKNGSEESIIRTMAHELGHGAFSLRHTFTEEKNTLPEKGTDNLMDYANGNKLFKYQWDRMRYPEIVMGLFEGDEAGAMKYDNTRMLKFLSTLRTNNETATKDPGARAYLKENVVTEQDLKDQKIIDFMSTLSIYKFRAPKDPIIDAFISLMENKKDDPWAKLIEEKPTPVPHDENPILLARMMDVEVETKEKFTLSMNGYSLSDKSITLYAHESSDNNGVKLTFFNGLIAPPGVENKGDKKNVINIRKAFDITIHSKNAEAFKSYIKLRGTINIVEENPDSEEIIIDVVRKRSNKYITIDELSIRGTDLKGAALELGKGTDAESKATCTDYKADCYECKRILPNKEGEYFLFTITNSGGQGQHKYKTLRLLNTKVNGSQRDGILIHMGDDISWTAGCILAMSGNDIEEIIKDDTKIFAKKMGYGANIDERNASRVFILSMIEHIEEKEKRLGKNLTKKVVIKDDVGEQALTVSTGYFDLRQKANRYYYSNELYDKAVAQFTLFATKLQEKTVRDKLQTKLSEYTTKLIPTLTKESYKESEVKALYETQWSELYTAHAGAITLDVIQYDAIAKINEFRTDLKLTLSQAINEKDILEGLFNDDLVALLFKRVLMIPVDANDKKGFKTFVPANYTQKLYDNILASTKSKLIEEELAKVDKAIGK